MATRLEKKKPAAKVTAEHQAVPKQALRPAFMESSAEADFTGAVIFTHAPQGHGKSTFALTVSEQCPWPLPAKKATTIDDIFYIATDAKATLGFRTLNVAVANVLDLCLLRSQEARWKAAGFKSSPSASEAINFAIEEAGKWAEAHPNGHLVLDTASKLDSDFWCEFAYDQNGNLRNGLQIAGIILQLTRVMHDRFMSMPWATVHYLAHSKALNEFEGTISNPNDPVTRKAFKALEGARIVPAITGQSVGVFNRDAILELSIEAPRDPGTKRRKRWVYSVPHEGKETKCRFEAALSEKEEACLRLILEKVGAFRP